MQTIKIVASGLISQITALFRGKDDKTSLRKGIFSTSLINYHGPDPDWYYGSLWSAEHCLSLCTCGQRNGKHTDPHVICLQYIHSGIWQCFYSIMPQIFRSEKRKAHPSLRNFDSCHYFTFPDPAGHCMEPVTQPGDPAWKFRRAWIPVCHFYFTLSSCDGWHTFFVTGVISTLCGEKRRQFSSLLFD